MTARKAWAQVVDIAATAALPIAVLLVAVALATNLDGWLAVPVATTGAWVAVGIGLAMARWYRRSGAR